jgi:RNA polymerase sigma factor (sigma-70 family)
MRPHRPLLHKSPYIEWASNGTRLDSTIQSKIANVFRAYAQVEGEEVSALRASGRVSNAHLRLEDFETMFSDHATAVHAYLARRAPMAADDLLSEVFMAALDSRASFDPRRGEVRPWLYGIARHIIAGHFRSIARAARPSRVESVGITDEWEAVDARLDAIAVGDDLRDALRELSPDEREVLLLVAWEQMSPSEAAQVLAIPTGTARSRLHRARKRINALLGERMMPQPPSSE